MTFCQICHDVIPEADWSAHITLHENASMDERWNDAKDWPNSQKTTPSEEYKPT